MTDTEDSLRILLARMGAQVVQVRALSKRVKRRARVRALRNALIGGVAAITVAVLGVVGVRALVPTPKLDVVTADNGELIAFGVYKHEELTDRPRHVEELYVVRPSGSGLSRIVGAAKDVDTTVITSPSWSPDGDQIAFGKYVVRDGQSRQSILIIDRDGSESTKIFVADPGQSIAQIEWSPDGTRIGFILVDVVPGTSNESDFIMRLYTMDPDGTDAVAITDENDQVVSFSWSPDSRQMVFTLQSLASKQRFAYDLFTMNADGTGVKALTENGRSMDPAWSPDGTRIAFVSYDTGSSFRQRDLYVMNSDGSETMQLLASTQTEVSPEWSPDGGRLVFARFGRGNHCQLRIMRSDGSDAQKLVGFKRLGGCAKEGLSWRSK